jgi:hypothetical protein
MGSSHKSNSTRRRAKKARSVKPAPTPRHRPIPQCRKPTTRLRTAADVLRDTRGSGLREPDNLSPFAKDNAFAKNLCRRLDLIHDVVITVAIALESESTEHDLDFANVLTRSAADPLWGIIVELGGADEEVDHD